MADKLRLQSKLRKLITDQSIFEACKNCLSRQASLKYLNLKYDINTNITWITKKIDLLKIDTSHWLGQGHLRGKTHNWGNSVSFQELLVENHSSKLNQGQRKRIFKEKFLENKCSICGIGDIWNNKKLVLQIDHINGNPFDHRLENLRPLCPNCHTQTETFCGKNKVKTKKEKKCCDCDKEISQKATRCKNCTGFQQNKDKEKIQWPSNEELVELIKKSNFSALSKQLGVSDKAIRKRLKVRGLLDKIKSIR